MNQNNSSFEVGLEFSGTQTLQELLVKLLLEKIEAPDFFAINPTETEAVLKG